MRSVTELQAAVDFVQTSNERPAPPGNLGRGFRSRRGSFSRFRFAIAAVNRLCNDTMTQPHVPTDCSGDSYVFSDQVAMCIKYRDGGGRVWGWRREVAVLALTYTYLTEDAIFLPGYGCLYSLGDDHL